HRQNLRGVLFPGASLLAALRRVVLDDVSERSLFQNACCGVANIEKHLVQSPVLDVAFDQRAELLGVTKWRESPVHEANDLGKVDFRRRPAQPIAALGAANTLHHARVFHFEQDELEELLRQAFVVGYIADTNGSLVVAPGQPHHRLQSVETLPGDFHRRTSIGFYSISIMSLGVVDYFRERRSRRTGD